MERQQGDKAIEERANTLIAQSNKIIQGAQDDQNARAILGVIVELLVDIRAALNRIENAASDPDRIFGPRFDQLPDK